MTEDNRRLINLVHLIMNCIVHNNKPCFCIMFFSHYDSDEYDKSDNANKITLSSTGKRGKKCKKSGRKSTEAHYRWRKTDSQADERLTFIETAFNISYLSLTLFELLYLLHCN